MSDKLDYSEEFPHDQLLFDDLIEDFPSSELHFHHYRVRTVVDSSQMSGL